MSKGVFAAALLAAVGSAVFAPSRPAVAETLAELLPPLIENDDKIKAAAADTEAARQSYRVALGAYLPSLDGTANQGYEQQDKHEAANTATGFHELSLSAKQLIWDFGKTLADIEGADLGITRAALQLENTKQNLTLEAVTAYLNLLRAVESLRYAQQSEDNIRRQTGLEEFRVERGSGVASDVLQAKAQLAGANALRVRSEGALVAAVNRYRTVFHREVGDLAGYRRPRLPLEQLPTAVDDAVNIALKNNLDLRTFRINEQIARESTKSSFRKMLAPKIEFGGDLKYKQNVAGTLGLKVERLVKVEMTYPFISGGKDIATYNASLAAESATGYRLADLTRSVEERIRNGWQNLQTSRSNAEFLRNQANVAGEFLEVSRRERQIGRRTLLDVLSGETSFITAVSAAVSAETDTALAVYGLLASMGSLDPAAVASEAPEAPKAPGTPEKQ